MLKTVTKDRLRPYVLAARRLRHHPPTLTGLAWAQRPSYAQFAEDRFLTNYFGEKRDGFYVDVGAYHPFMLSNTCLLYQSGWRGINLEPDPAAFALFEKYRPRDINVQVAVSNIAGTAAFTRSGSFAGIENEQHLWPGMAGERITVRTETLTGVLGVHLPAGAPIDVLDVDCEGHDLAVLQSNDWDRFRPHLVLAEAHTEEAADLIRTYLIGQSYRLRATLELTMVFERT